MGIDSRHLYIPSTIMSLIGDSRLLFRKFVVCHGGAWAPAQTRWIRLQVEPRFETISTQIYCRGLNYWMILQDVQFRLQDLGTLQ